MPFSAGSANAARQLVPSQLRLWPSASTEHSDIPKVQEFLRDFDDNMAALQRIVEKKNVLLLPELFQEERLETELTRDDPKPRFSASSRDALGGMHGGCARRYVCSAATVCWSNA